jgi:predicted RNase H-like HicB family nuclease
MIPAALTTDQIQRDNAAEAIAVHIAGLEADGEDVPEEHGQPQLLSVTVAA